MDNFSKNKGDFSKNLFSLQMQLKTLLDGVGSENACSFLDQLSELNETERGIILKVFQRALNRLKESGISVKSLRDEQLEQFEETLYENLVDGMNAFKGGRSSGSFSVVDGGKLPTRKKSGKMISFSEAKRRRAKKQADSPIIN